MSDAIAALQGEIEKELANVKSSQDVESLQVKYLGRKGPIQQLMGHLKDLSPEERPTFGQKVNTLKQNVEGQLIQLKESFILAEEGVRLQQEAIDITLPGRRRFLGNRHLLTQAMDEILDILIGMGFTVQYGPDIDTEYYNFESLNFEPDHPARDMQDTFYITDDVLLRTQTTNVQGHVMEEYKPPIRIISPGKVYRNEAISARSHVFFHQIDPLFIDKGVTLADLISTLDEFITKLFQKEVPRRYRGSYFPFVEPGLEVDVHCLLCNGSGCPICKYSGWLEVLGAGMVHPNVLKAGGIDPEVYSGFAWGMGLERLVLVKYGIPDIRLFTENDIRFLRQFQGV